MDVDTFRQALVSYGDKLSVFTAPPEIVPLDIMGAGELNAILDLAQRCFDIVIVEMPRTLVVWSEAVLNRADIFFATLELDLRSAQDAMRFIKALRAEDLPLEKIQYVMNRAPGGMDLTGKSRVKKLAESLGVEIKTLLPDGGKAVQEAGDNGQPLAEAAKKNPLRKEIAKLAQGLHRRWPQTQPQPSKSEHRMFSKYAKKPDATAAEAQGRNRRRRKRPRAADERRRPAKRPRPRARPRSLRPSQGRPEWRQRDDKEAKRRQRLDELKTEMHHRLLDNLNLSALENRQGKRASRRESTPSPANSWPTWAWS
jgi:MinD-like ATPase involved in chromosome partitioning or flagellar assembly